MTQLLEKAYNRLTELPDPEQDAIASLILERLNGKENNGVTDAEQARLQAALWEHIGTVRLPARSDGRSWSEMEGFPETDAAASDAH